MSELDAGQWPSRPKKRAKLTGIKEGFADNGSLEYSEFDSPSTYQSQ